MLPAYAAGTSCLSMTQSEKLTAKSPILHSQQIARSFSDVACMLTTFPAHQVAPRTNRRDRVLRP